MNRQEAEEYTESIGMIVSGSYRQVLLARKLGVPKALGLSTEEWVRDRLGGYVRLSIEDRREVVAELAAEGNSNMAIAETLGVAEGTVRNDLSSQNYEPREENDNETNGASNSNSQSCDRAEIITLAEEYRKHAAAHTTHVALANKDIHRAGRVLVELKELVDAAGENWWDFYAANFDKPRKWAEQAMRAID